MEIEPIGLVDGLTHFASYEDGVHVLRPEGMPVDVRRSRDDEHLVWEYLGFTARLRYLAASDSDPAEVLADAVGLPKAD